MLGVFDSGRGGRNALATLRALAPRADIAFFADTANAPYGTKSPEELCRLIDRDISLLRRAGATAILIACCTASCMYARLPYARRHDVFPIVRPTAAAAVRQSRTHRYAVIATDATVRSGVFEAQLKERVPTAHVTSIAAPRLVTLAECERTSLTDPDVREALTPLVDTVMQERVDTVILGCTHFSPFAAALHTALPHVRTVASAEEGARAFAYSLAPQRLEGAGKTIEIL